MERTKKTVSKKVKDKKEETPRATSRAKRVHVDVPEKVSDKKIVKKASSRLSIAAHAKHIHTKVHTTIKRHTEKLKQENISLVVAPALLVIIGVLFLGTVLSGEAPKNSLSNLPNNTVATYVNSTYGFSFKHPRAFSQVRESPDPKLCLDNRTWNDLPVKSVTVAEIQNISVTVGCQQLSEEIVGQFGSENGTSRDIVVRGKKSYIHEFRTKDGYIWRVAQVPLTGTHYLELSYNYKNLPEYVPLTDSEWEGVIASIVPR